MRVKAAAAVTAAVVGITLSIPATAAADDIWNPFLFIEYCSTCGPLTPLTFEQADARELLPWAVLPPGPPVSDPVPFDDGVIPIPFAPPNDGGSPSGGLPPVHLPPPSGGGNGGNGNGSGGNNGGGNGGGLDYSITVQPPSGPGGPDNGPPGGGPNGNPPTFEIGDGPGGGINPVTTHDPYDGGQQGETLIPEPATLLLLGSGLSAAVLRRRRSQRTAA